MKRALIVAATGGFLNGFLTISDSLVNPDEDTTAEERQNTFTDMMKVGLETLIAD